MDSTDDHRELLALREALHWRQAREDLTYFAETIEIPMVPRAATGDDEYAIRVNLAAHHRLMLQAAQDLLTGKLKVDGVMAFFPPGAAKSTMLSVVTPAWAAGYFPAPYEFIATSYNSTHAEKFSRRVRQIAEGKAFRQIFNGITIKADERRIEDWATTNGNGYQCGGLRAGITGKRADVVIIDDPVKDREEADSEIMRASNWDAYVDVLDSRLKPGGKIFLIMTRWHEDDLAGRLLGEDWKGQSGIRNTTDGRRYLVLNCPVFAEHKDDPLGRKIDEMLWPEYFRIDEMRRREKLGGRTWSSLWQQRPAPNEGAILNRNWWRKWPHEEPPVCEYVFLAYDTSFKKAITNDPSAMTAWGIFRTTAEDRTLAGRVVRQGEEIFHVIMLGAWEERVMATDLVERIVGRKENGKLVKQGHIHIWPEVLQKGMILVEDKASGQGIIQELQRMRLPVTKVTPADPASGSGDRQLRMAPRAQTVAFLLSAGSVWYMEGAMSTRVIEQCAAVPFAQHDDLACTAIYALQYFRDKFYFTVPSDFLDPQEEYERQVEEYENDRHRRSVGGYGHIRQESHSYVPDGQRRGYGRIG